MKKSKRQSWEYSDTKVKIDKLPDPKKHQQISFLKSGVRIIGYIFLPINIASAAILLIISEIIGIFEELV